MYIPIVVEPLSTMPYPLEEWAPVQAFFLIWQYPILHRHDPVMIKDLISFILPQYEYSLFPGFSADDFLILTTYTSPVSPHGKHASRYFRQKRRPTESMNRCAEIILKVVRSSVVYPKHGRKIVLIRGTVLKRRRICVKSPFSTRWMHPSIPLPRILHQIPLACDLVVLLA